MCFSHSLTYTSDIYQQIQRFRTYIGGGWWRDPENGSMALDIVVCVHSGDGTIDLNLTHFRFVQALLLQRQLD